MSLLYPLMLVGALAVGVPLWLHLRRRDETDLVAFSAMRFLDDQPVARARPLWPRDWLLLLLRIAALLLLVTAFAWPYSKDEQAVVVEESRVYLLDNTLSHQADDGFARGREQIADALESATLRTQVAVIEIGALPRTLVQFGEPPGDAARRIRELQPKSVRGPFLDAFRAAADTLETSLGEQRRIVLVSDSQANQWREGLGTQPFLKNVEIELPESASTVADNLSLSEPAARRFAREGDDFIECVVRITRCGRPRQATVVFSANGEEVARRDVEFPVEDSGKEAGAENGPGDATSDRTEDNPTKTEPVTTAATETLSVFAEWRAPPDQWVLGAAELLMPDDPDSQSADSRGADNAEASADVLSGDNRVYFSLRPVREGRVTAFADSPYLRQALAPEVMRGRWNATFRDRPQTAAADAPQPDSRDSQTAPDVLLVESHMLTQERVRDGIRDTLNDGRGVILLVNRSTPLIVGFLRELGIDMQPHTARTGTNAAFRYVFMDHPIFQPFRAADFGDLSNITVTRHRRLKLDQAMPLAFAANGDPLVFDIQQTTGRMLVFAFNFDRRDTNWPIHPTFIPFLDRCLSYVRADEMTEKSYEPGESVLWNVPRGDAPEQIVLRRREPPTIREDSSGEKALDNSIDNPTEPLVVPVTNRQSRFQLPAQPGHYELRYEPDGPLQFVLDVNPPARESELIFESQPAALTAWTISEDADEDLQVDELPEAIELSELEILQQNTWWWFLIGAAVFLVIETIWIGITSTAVAETGTLAES